MSPFHQKVSVSMLSSDMAEYWRWIFLDQQELVNIFIHRASSTRDKCFLSYYCLHLSNKGIVALSFAGKWRGDSFSEEITNFLIYCVDYFNIFPWHYRYKIIKEVGDGTFGSVWRAISKQTGEVVSMIYWYDEVSSIWSDIFVLISYKICRLLSRKWRRNITPGRSA